MQSKSLYDSYESLELFPKEGEELWIKQGASGDCYLLSAFIAIWNNGGSCQAQLSSMFKKLPDGNIEVKIKRAKPLPSSQIKLMEDKYSYHHEDGYDIIKVPVEQQKRILNQSRGLLIAKPKSGESNSLAVLIFERLASYYFKPKNPLEINSHAHNARGNFDSFEEHSRSEERFDTGFLGDLLGFKESLCTNIKKIQAYKRLFPSEFIFYGVQYKSEPHAMILATIEESGNGEYILNSINPWDTSRFDKFKLESNQPIVFVFFVLDEKEHEFKMALASCDLEIATYILNDKTMYNFMLQDFKAKKNNSSDESYLYASLVNQLQNKEDIQKELSTILDDISKLKIRLTNQHGALKAIEILEIKMMLALKEGREIEKKLNNAISEALPILGKYSGIKERMFSFFGFKSEIIQHFEKIKKAIQSLRLSEKDGVPRIDAQESSGLIPNRGLPKK